MESEKQEDAEEIEGILSTLFFVHRNAPGVTLRIGRYMKKFGDRGYHKRLGYETLWDFIHANYPHITRRWFRDMLRAAETVEAIEDYNWQYLSGVAGE